MTNMTLQVFPRTAFGQTRLYPANPAAQAFAKNARQLTLDWKSLASAKQLGFAVELVPDPEMVKEIANLQNMIAAL